MTNQEKLEAIRAVIIKAVPEKATHTAPTSDGRCMMCFKDIKENPVCKMTLYKPDLQDLLLTIHKYIYEDKISYSDGYEYIVELCYRTQYYNLSLSFEENMKDEKLVEFIYNILK